MIEPYFYITTTLPYVNGEPHIGFALEIVAADVIARYQRTPGKEVVFNTGTDEHGQKIYEKAQELGLDTQEFVDQNAKTFMDLKELLNLSFTHFTRTTDAKHIKAAQEFWKLCLKNGDVYKRMYKLNYCIGCELEKQASELVDGACPLHPNLKIEVREEENYFFRFSKYQDELLNLYENSDQFVIPEKKLKEIKSFVSAGIEDFSISRLKAKMPWGIPVPDDDEHVMYVWFDALVNYISVLGWPNDKNNYEKFWPAIQVAGKDNLRQQSAMWQAMLISAGLSPSKRVLINGFIEVDGQKMSKSLGNIIAPKELVARYGTEATRYLLMNMGPFGDDIDTSWEKLDTTYTADLANGIGNLTSRLATLAHKFEFGIEVGVLGEELQRSEKESLDEEFDDLLSNYKLDKALRLLMSEVAELDKYLAVEKPWKLESASASPVLQQAISHLLTITKKLEIFMPETAQTIIRHFQTKKIVPIKPLFPRLT